MSGAGQSVSRAFVAIVTPDQFARLLSSLFDAAIRDDRWEDALDNFVDCVGAKSTILFAVENTFESYGLAKAGGALRGRRQTLIDYSQRFKVYEEQAMELFASSPPQSLIREVDLWPDLEALRVREDFLFQREEIGIFRRVGTRLSGNPAWFDACTVHFSDEIEEIPAENLSLLSSLLPSLAKVVELNRFFHILQAKYRAALAALDRVKIGVCVVEPRGHIVVANNEAERIFSLNDGIMRGFDERILCARDSDTAALHDAVDSVSRTAVGQNVCNETLLAVDRRSGAKPFLIEAVPLRDSLQEIDPGFTGAMVSIIDPENSRAFSTQNVAKLFGLSATEAEVCRLLVDGMSNEHIAETRNVSIETIKTQVRSIYRKVNVTGRADLIREILTVNPPIG